MLTYLDISATRVGIDPDFSFYLLSILNAGSLLGRLASGPLMDRFGENIHVTYIHPFLESDAIYLQDVSTPLVLSPCSAR